MSLSDSDVAYLQEHHSAAMITGPLSWFGGQLAEEEFLQAMVDEQRLIYEFEVYRSYGLN